CDETDCTFLSNFRIAPSSTPDRAMALLTTSTDAMMTTTGCEKPWKAFSAGTTPTSTAVNNTTTATRSYRHRSQMNNPSIPMAMSNASICTIVMYPPLME